MGDDQASSLEAYARRRFALAGAAVASRFPYCTPIEQLGVDLGEQRGGVVSFAHYDYLGLARDPRIAEAGQQAIDTFGFGAGASRLVGGECALHRQLESDLAQFLGVEDALSLVSGYGANVAVVGHLLMKDDLILVDESSHNSVVVGTQLSRAECIAFRHNDLDHLGDLLASRRGKFKRALVIVEGLYSMDGDIPDLPRLLEICKQYDAWLMIDEAHSIGVLGAHGRGITEHFGIPAAEIDIIVGTLSKAFVGCGAFIAAKKCIIDWLRFTLPGFVYSVGLPPPAAATARCALAIMLQEPERLEKLRRNSQNFAAMARARGLDLGAADGIAVVPILFPDIDAAMTAAIRALDEGYFVPPIVQIAVPKDGPRLRFFITAKHEMSDLAGVLEAICPIARGSTNLDRVTEHVEQSA